MIEQPIQQIVEQKSQVKSQGTQNKLRHNLWLMLECQFWIFHLFVAALSFYIISQLAAIDLQSNSVYSTDQYRYSLQAIQMWNKGYIIDIKQVNTDNCPQGYTELINYYWPGTIDGCYCQTVINNHATQYILQGACSSQLIGYGCNTVTAVSKQNMKMWKGGKLLCYKRVDSLNFYNSTLTTNQGVTMKTCAQNQSYQTSTLPQISCPITVISNTSLSSSSQTTLSLDLSQNLYYQSEQGYPIADFKLTQYNFCPFFNQTNISPDKSGNYVLEVNNYSTTCNGTDPRIVQFDYMTQDAYFTNNTRVYGLISNLPGFPRPSSTYNYRLGFIRYAAWTTTCRNTDTHNLLMATKHLQFNHITTQTKLILYVGVPCLLLYAFLFRLFFIIRHIFELKSKKQYNMIILTDQQIAQQIPNINIQKSHKKQLSLFLIQLILLFGTLIVLSIGAYYFTAESTWIKSVFNMKCTQDHLNWIFRYNQDVVDNCGVMIGRSVMFLLVLVICNVGHYVVRLMVGDLKQNQIKKIEELSNQGLIKDDIDQKKNNMIVDQHIHLQDSSDIILNKEKQELKVYDLDNFMSQEMQAVGETGLNFYSQSIQQDNFQLAKKKKKKGLKRKNLFKEGEEK